MATAGERLFVPLDYCEFHEFRIVRRRGIIYRDCVEVAWVGEIGDYSRGVGVRAGGWFTRLNYCCSGR
jgi:hypothetical protein